MTLHADALAWTLIHFCWQAAAIALVHGAVDRSLSGISSRARYGLALAAMLAMVGAAIVTLVHQEMLARVAALSAIIPIAGQGVALADMAMDAGAGFRQVSAWFPTNGALLFWLDMAWLAGVSLQSVRAIGGWIVLRRLVGAADMVVPVALSAMADGLCARMNLRPVALRLSRQVSGPFVMGLFRSVVVVPLSALAALSPDQLEAVLAHELAHVRRADYFWNLLQTLVETLFFFHPAIWWIGRRLREEREHCCDDLALAACGNPLAFATALCTLEAARSPGLALALDGHRPASALRRRVAHILGEAVPAPHRAASLLLAGIAALGLCAVSVLPHARASIVQPARAKTVQIRPVAIAGTATIATDASRTEAAGPAAPEPLAVTTATDPASVDPVPLTPSTPQAPRAESYEEAMLQAGYAGEMRALPSLEQDGVTPDYLRTILALGLGAPNAKQLRILWSNGARAADLETFRAVGAAPSTLYDFVGYSLFGVTPALITGMREAGFDGIPPGRLVKLAKVGVTPAYAAAARRARPDIDLRQLIGQRMDENDRERAASDGAGGG
ncbi:M56 family metallopeptidase [Sphingomonas alpina]|uniref:M48 family metalloprotease n=1 Tax=Sphingomonas alpina TaxID=653931 RepID=A0A7H0LNT2_9SPHN|nr:M56 family metallopeptidase [Sphingomonas alpina]QNQ11335.1 M48 family metalloprotease [Sphingomonas alpina]